MERLCITILFLLAPNNFTFIISILYLVDVFVVVAFRAFAAVGIVVGVGVGVGGLKVLVRRDEILLVNHDGTFLSNLVDNMYWFVDN